MPTTRIQRAQIHLKSTFVRKPKSLKQVDRDWQFTLVNNKINVYGDKRQPFGNMDHLAEITTPNNCQILVRYTPRISTQDLETLIEKLKTWGRNLIILQEPMVKAKIEKML